MFKKFWKSKVVPTALFTTWRVLENKLATKANLERHGITVASSKCSLCGVEEETDGRGPNTNPLKDHQNVKLRLLECMTLN